VETLTPAVRWAPFGLTPYLVREANQPDGKTAGSHCLPAGLLTRCRASSGTLLTTTLRRFQQAGRFYSSPVHAQVASDLS